MLLFRLFLFSSLLLACTKPVSEFKTASHRTTAFAASANPPRAPGGAAALAARRSSDPGPLKIATFNIQVFGPAKANRPEVLAQLATIIRRYDIVVVQEIKDASNEAPQRLLEAVNAESRSYALLLSPRSGLQPDDRRSQESYGTYYDQETVQALPGARLYDDWAEDRFQREPYLTHLRSAHGDFSFVLINVHTRPENALAEVASLQEVFRWATDVFEEENVIALGDFNASCRYASVRQLDSLAIRGPDFHWIVPDDSDSNVSAKTACAYDRIVTSESARPAFTGRWGVDRGFDDASVSDHWPVWAEFSVTSVE